MADPIEVARDGVEKFNAGDWSGLRSTLTSDTVEDEFATQRRLEGPEAVVAAAEGWKRAFPDAHGTVRSATQAATRPSWRSPGRALRLGTC
jgi:hypothetical protein